MSPPRKAQASRDIAPQQALAGFHPAPSNLKRADLKFIVNVKRPAADLVYTEPGDPVRALDAQKILECVKRANEAIKVIHDASEEYDIELFHILGLRNLSAMMGELFARQVAKVFAGEFMSNPNQDGSPDLLALTPAGIAYIKSKTRPDGTIESNKEHWSPFPHGGIEAKATCGDTPPAAKRRKPGIGESRWKFDLVNMTWKSHHQETQKLLSVYWDFVEGLPTFLGVFWRNDLDTTIGRANTDWPPAVTPKEGSRTTSVCIMRPNGVRKMGEGWLVMPREDEIQAPLCAVLGVGRPTLYVVA